MAAEKKGVKQSKLDQKTSLVLQLKTLRQRGMSESRTIMSNFKIDRTFGLPQQKNSKKWAPSSVLYCVHFIHSKKTMTCGWMKVVKTSKYIYGPIYS